MGGIFERMHTEVAYQKMVVPVAPAIEALLELDGLEGASSFWREWGPKNRVERQGAFFFLRSDGIGAVKEPRPIFELVRMIERWSYYRVRISPGIWRRTTQLVQELGFDCTYDVWKSAAALSVMERYWQDPKTVVVIGDGWGFLGALIRRYTAAKVYCVDLPRILVFQAATHTLARHELSVMGDTGVVLVPASQVESIRDRIDCAVNIASMQEMTPQTIAGYFHFLRSRDTVRFYCVNDAVKVLPGGEVVRFAEYPWDPRDEVFVDGVCPFYTHFLDTRTRPRGPRILGVRVPFLNYFDGTVLHRLVRLAS